MQKQIYKTRGNKSLFDEQFKNQGEGGTRVWFYGAKHEKINCKFCRNKQGKRNYRAYKFDL